jgi:hypothetical protein
MAVRRIDGIVPLERNTPIQEDRTMEPIMISDTELKTTIIGFVGLEHMSGNMAARLLTDCKCPTKSSAGLLV